MTNIKDFKLSTVGEDDRPDLEGKIVKYYYSDGDYVTGVVIGCNKSVGITIANVENKDHLAVCICGPSAPGPFYENMLKRLKVSYDEMYDEIVACIEAGKIDVNSLVEKLYYNHRAGTVDTNACPYRQ